MIDSFFYDINSLTSAEREQLANELNPEGAIIVMPPASSLQEYSSYKNVAEFLESRHRDVSKFVIAGIGSSDLGGAALARNVADFFKENVGAIVSGNSMSDFMTEALGGWFPPGAEEYFSSFFENTADKELSENEMLMDNDIHEYISKHPDSCTLLRLLISEKAKINFILGHSKGCMSLSNALSGFVSCSPGEIVRRRVHEIRIITTGAVTEMPDIFADKVRQYLGSMDWFGGINSHFNVQFESVMGAWHHTNQNLPFAMSIPDLLTKLEG